MIDIIFLIFPNIFIFPFKNKIKARTPDVTPLISR